jgi:hypothetical protein
MAANEDIQQQQRLGREEQLNAIKTWRYLRLAMVGLVVGLAAAVAFEWNKGGRSCFQGSVSAYYYTPVRAFFVSALVAIGVCLVCLRGNTVWEDGLLNLAGVFAAIVGFVPTPNVGLCIAPSIETLHKPLDIVGMSTADELAEQKKMVLETTINYNVANNVFAFIVMGGIGLALLAIIALRDKSQNGRKMSTAELLGYLAVALFYVLAIVIFYFARGWWVHHAHTWSAVALFAAILAVVIINALDHSPSDSQSSPAYRRLYRGTAAAMILAMSGVLIANCLMTWRHPTLVIEALFISLFAVFWAAQTKELWNKGLRPPATEGADRGQPSIPGLRWLDPALGAVTTRALRRPKPKPAQPIA